MIVRDIIAFGALYSTTLTNQAVRPGSFFYYKHKLLSGSRRPESLLSKLRCRSRAIRNRNLML